MGHSFGRTKEGGEWRLIEESGYIYIYIFKDFTFSYHISIINLGFIFYFFITNFFVYNYLYYSHEYYHYNNYLYLSFTTNCYTFTLFEFFGEEKKMVNRQLAPQLNLFLIVIFL